MLLKKRIISWCTDQFHSSQTTIDFPTFWTGGVTAFSHNMAKLDLYFIDIKGI